MIIDKKLILQIASLAKLELSDTELEKNVEEVRQILGYIEQINQCDTSEIQSGYALDVKNFQTLREDIVKESLPVAKALQNATHGRSKPNYIRVSKIIE